MYAPAPVPSDPKALPGYLRAEFERIKAELQPQKVLQLAVSYVEPDKPRDGYTCMADGSAWDPGSGAGVYTYYGAAWHKLG